MQHRVPVNQSLAAIDESFFVEFDEHFGDGFGQAFVHREAITFPVHGIAESTHLFVDRAAGFSFPFPDTFNKFFTAEIVTVLALRVELTFHHHLCGNTCMVGARLPQGVVTIHAMQAGEGVHQRVLESMTHVQRAGHIGRRNHDAVGCACAGGFEPAVGFPFLINGLFDVARGVGFVHQA